MAMPSEIPPPIETPDLDAVVLMLAQRMADSVGDAVGDVFNRTKSRNWMVGQLRKFGPWPKDEIRDAIERQRKLHRRTISDEFAPRAVTLTTRRPLLFLEASAWPAWGERVIELGGLVTYPMTILELTDRARMRLGWSENHVKQTTAAAEDANELWYDRAFNHWHRTERRLLLADKKKQTKTERTTRHLPVKLTEADQNALVRRLQEIDDERTALGAELEEHTRRIRAQLKNRADARERVLQAWKTGREVQSVECEDRWDYAAKQVTTVRKDTGEVVETRAMTQDELQVPIPEAASA